MGKTVVSSLIHHLLYVQKPNMQSAKQILLTGDSAGGVATLNNADFVWSLISPAIPNVQYKGILFYFILFYFILFYFILFYFILFFIINKQLKINSA
jgi:hypothetical protein